MQPLLAMAPAARGPSLRRSPHKQLRWLQKCLRGSWAGRWTPQGPGCTCWLFVCGSRTSMMWDPCPCILCLLSFRRHCPQCSPQLCEERSQGLECWVTQVAAMDPAQCPSEGATGSSETSPDHGDIWWHQDEELVRVNGGMPLMWPFTCAIFFKLIFNWRTFYLLKSCKYFSKLRNNIRKLLLTNIILYLDFTWLSINVSCIAG